MIVSLLVLVLCGLWDFLIVLCGLAEVHCAHDGKDIGRLMVLALAVGLISITATRWVVFNFTVVNIVAWSFGGAAGTLLGVWADRNRRDKNGQ